MEHEEHLNEQGQPRLFTRATARHLRRKRLKDARRAEKESSKIVNGVNDSSNRKTSIAKENNEAGKAQLKSLSVEPENRLPQLSNSLDSSKFKNKAQNQVIERENTFKIKKILNHKQDIQNQDCRKGDYTKVQQIRTVNSDPGHSSHLSHLCVSSNGTKHEIGIPQISQTTSNEKEEYIKAPIITVPLKYNSSRAQSYSVLDKNTNCLSFNYSDPTSLDDLNIGLVGNQETLQLSDFSNIASDSYAQNNIEIKNNELETDIRHQVVSDTLSNKKQTDIIEKNNIKNESNINFKTITAQHSSTGYNNTESSISANTEHNNTMETSAQKPASSNNMTDFLEKTREQIKAEREAKKAAKAAAKLKVKSKKVDDVKTELPIASSENLKKTVDTDNINTKNVESTREASKESTIQSPYVIAKDGISEGKSEEKSKAELRAERRAKQEAQRAAKQQQLLPNDRTKSKEAIKPRTDTISDNAPKKSVKKSSAKEDVHEVSLFKHLYHERERSLFNIATINSTLHPAIVRLGVQYANKIIVGSNARCVALLAAIKQVVRDFEKPAQADFVRGLEANLQEAVAYLHHCRPLAVSMQNAMRHLKWQMTQSTSLSSDNDVKNKLKSVIDTYILEQIQLAGKAISLTIQKKISNGNIILTYGYSSLIHNILLDAHAAGKQFRVVIVDGRPWLEGKEQLRRLAKHGIECSYILINALSFIMPEVSKVFLGAHAILANGAVMSRVGTAQVALMAKAFNVPVLVACETHKSCERVQTDSIVYNELGDADQLVANQINSKKSLLSEWRTKRSLNLLNITYDVTPADLVTAVVTELAILPCTSVPVILRIKPSEI